MKRRTLLRGAVGLVAGAGLAGCTGAGGEVPVTAEPPPAEIATETDAQSGSAPDSTPAEGSVVAITDFGGRADSDGSLIATVTVRNRSDTQQVRLVRATVVVEGVQTSNERFVLLAPGEERRVFVHLDVDFDAWNNSGSLTPQVIRRTPATPVPTDRQTPTETVGGAGVSPTPTAAETGNETGTDSTTSTGSETGTAPGTATGAGTATE